MEERLSIESMHSLLCWDSYIIFLFRHFRYEIHQLLHRELHGEINTRYFLQRICCSMERKYNNVAMIHVDTFADTFNISFWRDELYNSIRDN